MNVSDLLARLADGITSRRVFGDPYERDGVAVIPAAEVRGGGGGGSGDKGIQGSGGGGGLGLVARPVGAYVIKDGTVKWEPAFDLNRAILGGQVLAIVALLVLHSIVRGKRR